VNGPRQTPRARASAGIAPPGLQRPTSAQDLARATETFAAFAPLLHAMRDAMQSPDPGALQQATEQLQAGLSAAQPQLPRVAAAQTALHRAELAQLAQMAAQISGQIQAQRQALARAQAAAQRRADILLPTATAHSGYGAQGASERGASTGAVQA
jgi:hypothetical protein